MCNFNLHILKMKNTLDSIWSLWQQLLRWTTVFSFQGWLQCNLHHRARSFRSGLFLAIVCRSLSYRTKTGFIRAGPENANNMRGEYETNAQNSIVDHIKCFVPCPLNSRFASPFSGRASVRMSRACVLTHISLFFTSQMTNHAVKPKVITTYNSKSPLVLDAPRRELHGTFASRSDVFLVLTSTKKVLAETFCCP